MIFLQKDHRNGLKSEPPKIETSWWFSPLMNEKYAQVKLDHFPKDRVKIKKMKPPPRKKTGKGGEVFSSNPKILFFFVTQF